MEAIPTIFNRLKLQECLALVDGDGLLKPYMDTHGYPMYGLWWCSVNNGE
jgi:hypothetical protein